MSKALVLHSGGLDSSVLLAMALETCEEVQTIGFDYGQRHARELESAQEVQKHYGVIGHEISVPASLFQGLNSTLTTEAENPHLSYAEIRESEGPSPSYVPFRNANLLSMATSLALCIGFDRIYFGAHADDAHNWAYPDCTPQFIKAMGAAISVGSYQKVGLYAPFQDNTKKDIVVRGQLLFVPFEKTWSCYEGGAKHCGLCPTCVSRKEAFSQACVLDPTEYLT